MSLYRSRSRRMRVLGWAHSLAASLLLFACGQTVVAQTPEDERLLSALVAFELGDWQVALRDLDQVQDATLSLRDRAIRDLYRGVIALGIGDPVMARSRMADAITADPEVRLDPTLHAPSRIQFFLDIREELLASYGDARSIEWVNPPNVLLRGVATQVRVQGRNGAGDPVALADVRWSVSDSSVASVNSEGIVSPREEGEVRIEARWGLLTANHSVEVRPARAIGLNLEPSPLRLFVGDSATITGSAVFEGGQRGGGVSIVLRSNDLGVVRVLDDGRVVAVAAGQSEIVATSENLSEVLPVEVREVPGARILLGADRREVPAGQGVSISAMVLDAEGRVLPGRFVDLRSSDPQIAEIAPDGSLVGRRPGFVEVIAQSEAGLVARLGIEVLPAEVDNTSSPSLWAGMIIPFVVFLVFRMF